MTSEVKFRGHPLQNSREDWAPMRGMHREIADVYSRVRHACDHTQMRFFVRGVGTRRLRARHRNPSTRIRSAWTTSLNGWMTTPAHMASVRSSWWPTRQVSLECCRGSSSRTRSKGLRGTGRANWSTYFASSARSDGLQMVNRALPLPAAASSPQERHPTARRARARLLGPIDPCVVRDEIWWP